MQKEKIVIRELSTLGELLQLFRIRWRVYHEHGYLPDVPEQLDVDPYDPHSRFMGAFIGERMVGGVRMIQGQGYSPALKAIREILNHCQTPELRELPNRQTSFFCQEAFSYDEYLREDLFVVEFGRTVCLPEYRGYNVGLGLVHAILGLAVNSGVALGVGTAPPKVKEFYRKLGCQILESKGTYFDADHNTSLACILVDIEGKAGEVPATVNAARQLREHGCIHMCSERGCLENHRHTPVLEILPLPALSLQPMATQSALAS